MMTIMSEAYQNEKEDFYATKCTECMCYLNAETKKCDNDFCEGKIPSEWR